MEIEVGMFVRTKNNGIVKIYDIDNHKTKWKYTFKLKKQDEDGTICLGVLCDDDIMKASHYLLGDDEKTCLIEVGDYVNGKLVIHVSEEYINDYAEVLTIISFSEKDYIYYEKDIRTIVTKEQFEKESYKVN